MKNLIAVVFAVIILFVVSAIAVAKEDFRVYGFTKVICSNESGGVAPCGSTGLRVRVKSESVFFETELSKATRDNANWFRELMFSSKKGKTEFSAGRFFVGGAYAAPAPNSEVVTNPRVPVTFYGWGGRFATGIGKNGDKIMLDFTGETDAPDGFRSGGFDNPELSVRFSHPTDREKSGNVSAGMQLSKNFTRVAVDFKHSPKKDMKVRGAIYYDAQEGVGSDKFGTYLFASKVVYPNMELHVQGDYQSDQLAGESAVWTFGMRAFDKKGLSLTVDREIYTDQQDRLAVRLMYDF